MAVLKLSYLDIRSVLIQNYKLFGLTEIELTVLLLIDVLNKESPSLITGEQLEVKMNISASEIDDAMIQLMNKGFLSYENVNDIMVTSMNNTYEKVLNYVAKEAEQIEQEKSRQIEESSLQRILGVLEEQLKRSLTPLEIEYVTNWFKDGVSEEVIQNAINECLLKQHKISIKQIDRFLIKNIQHTDRVSEGASTVDEKTKKDIKQALDIASYDWVNDK